MEKPNKDFCFIAVQPDDTHFMWEVEVQINNLRKYGLSDKMKVIVFWMSDENKKSVNLHWLILRHTYPEVEFTFIKGDESELSAAVLKYIYVSALRPYCLDKYWKMHPEMEQATVFYLDSDVIFTKDPLEFIEPLLEGDTCYVSNTQGYLGINYMRSKAREVDLHEDHFIDLAAEITKIGKNKIIDNDHNTGGAQYILKNIPSDFWKKVLDDCILIRRRFMIDNQRFFQARAKERELSAEDAGIQSWCADMWAVLYNLYYYGKEVIAPTSMDFAWATDNIKKLETTSILHNAGVGGANAEYLFDKGKYRAGKIYVDKWPYEEDLSYVNKEYCSYRYVQEIQETYKEFINELQRE